MQRLTFDGVNDLYLTPYGAHTLAEYEELRTVRKRAVRQPLPATPVEHRISDALAARNERCIDEHGCGTFGG